MPNPVRPPVKSDGAKIPPFPPDPRVREVATIFSRTMRDVNTISVHGLTGRKVKILFFNTLMLSPFNKVSIVLYPSPKSGGKRYIRIPSVNPPKIAFGIILFRFSKKPSTFNVTRVIYTEMKPHRMPKRT